MKAGERQEKLFPEPTAVRCCLGLEGRFRAAWLRTNLDYAQNLFSLCDLQRAPHRVYSVLRELPTSAPRDSHKPHAHGFSSDWCLRPNCDQQEIVESTCDEVRSRR